MHVVPSYYDIPSPPLLIEAREFFFNRPTTYNTNTRVLSCCLPVLMWVGFNSIRDSTQQSNGTVTVPNTLLFMYISVTGKLKEKYLETILPVQEKKKKVNTSQETTMDVV